MATRQTDGEPRCEQDSAFHKKPQHIFGLNLSQTRFVYLTCCCANIYLSAWNKEWATLSCSWLDATWNTLLCLFVQRTASQRGNKRMCNLVRADLAHRHLFIVIKRRQTRLSHLVSFLNSLALQCQWFFFKLKLHLIIDTLICVWLSTLVTDTKKTFANWVLCL